MSWFRSWNKDLLDTFWYCEAETSEESPAQKGRSPRAEENAADDCSHKFCTKMLTFKHTLLNLCQHGERDKGPQEPQPQPPSNHPGGGGNGWGAKKQECSLCWRAPSGQGCHWTLPTSNSTLDVLYNVVCFEIIVLLSFILVLQLC